MDIQMLLNQNKTAVSHLLQRYKIAGGVNMESIKKGHDKYGENFMMRLLEIIVPDTNNFSTLITPATGAFLQTGIQKTLSASQTAQLEEIQSQAATKGKFWIFWDNLLGRIGQTGATIGQFREDAAGTVNSEEYLSYQAQQRNQSRVIFAVAGVFVVLVVLLLIFRKK